MPDDELADARRKLAAVEAERDRLRACIAAIRADNDNHAREYASADQRFRDGMSHALSKFMLSDALAAGEAPTEPSTCKHGQTKAHRFRSLVTYPRGEFDCPGPVPQGGTE